MGTETGIPDHPHSDFELCEPAIRLYSESLRRGRLPRAEVAPAPCLIEMALLHPDPRDPAMLRPATPSAVLAHLLQPITRNVHEQVRRSAALVESLAPLAAIASEDPNLSITVLEGKRLIDSALHEAAAAAETEVLTAQPGGHRSPEQIEQGLANGLSAVERGARLRHIYQHPARYSAPVRNYLEQMPPGQVQVRTMELTIDRLIIFDHAVAFIPATADRDVALQIRHPALVRYLVQVYEVLWAQATPIAEHLQTAAPGTPVTAVQHSIARLLVEGHHDEAVARKLGFSVRTCRTHIAKLMQTLDATSRTHLGALLVQSGIAGGTQA
ncbi:MULTISPECIES: LuxR C-terminal-related transcriptional regulator [unclassified Streptomyces]|uniref:helix-turn-helix transcriptional regulator n=1 Tax=unclassified Streptomyces TaxID=2593676 RepID=UPI0022526508|nr:MULTISPECIES: LuxR C-terminal-related transcriptional regulator [unclassified Streptomyces]MCX5141256.1 LuxR C-terminal-related transcriptional regulator [Streptomyces sp. NBC_00338]WRZ65772.1 LuxR C-terminal-related transcriptional regulator [Streptomyces sp. NBC_01257]WSU59768.1 LuxR C-terminal-related transcriptional regulator [Streptomyces sp. NBC_01104]